MYTILINAEIALDSLGVIKEWATTIQAKDEAKPISLILAQSEHIDVM